MKNVIVIHESDAVEKIVIGVASSRDKALEVIKEYYGQHVMSHFKDVRKNNIDFTCRIKTEGKFASTFDIIGECFFIDSI